MKSLQVVVWLLSGTGAMPCRRRMLPAVWSETVAACEANHQILDLCTDARSAGRAAVFLAIELGGNQLALAAGNGIGFGDARHLLQAFPPRAPFDFRHREPFAVRGQQITRRACLQNSVFGRRVLILQGEFLTDQSGNVGQELRYVGFICLQSPS